jgi:hypothetical protein
MIVFRGEPRNQAAMEWRRRGTTYTTWLASLIVLTLALTAGLGSARGAGQLRGRFSYRRLPRARVRLHKHSALA